MGNKRAMLNGELGAILNENTERASRFVDLFSGSASVSKYIATTTDISVVSIDLQEYSKIFAESVLLRTYPIKSKTRFEEWFTEAEQFFWDAIKKMNLFNRNLAGQVITKNIVQDCRMTAMDAPAEFFITRHYGGHYFSLEQSLALDSLYQTLPRRNPHKSVALASILDTASKASSSPGHMAQPFQPSETLIKYINDSWKVEVFQECKKSLELLCQQHALQRGMAHTANALDFAEKVKDGDLVFCDPPYSDAQYSRFYHVLEGIAIGGWDSVQGAGRSPSIEKRAISGFSKKTSSKNDMALLLEKLRKKECTVIITFPEQKTSNGLEAASIELLAGENWKIEMHKIDFSHRTLGGTITGRGGKRNVVECVLVLT